MQNCASHGTSAFERQFTAGVLVENPPHRFGSRGIAMATMTPARFGRLINQPEVRFVDQIRRPPRVAR